MLRLAGNRMAGRLHRSPVVAVEGVGKVVLHDDVDHLACNAPTRE